MTLQWTLISYLLYVEVGIVLLLIVPWIKPTTWKKLFKSRVAHGVVSNLRTASFATAGVLLILFMDAIRETRKYSHIEEALQSGNIATASGDSVMHSHLFHAQRNFYITGFALMLFLVIYRLVKLIFLAALLEQAAEASLRQAQSASEVGKKHLDKGNDEEDRMNKELREQIEATRKERDTIKQQAEALQKDYEGLRRRLDAKE